MKRAASDGSKRQHVRQAMKIVFSVDGVRTTEFEKEQLPSPHEAHCDNARDYGPANRVNHAAERFFHGIASSRQEACGSKWQPSWPR
jgi:hypothetical protein